MSTTIGEFGALPSLKGLKKTLSKWAVKRLRIFPIPGLTTLLTKGFNPYQKGIEIVSTPRHANVMLISGPLTKNLEQHAVVAYAQMPRPRILVFAGFDKANILPTPDLVIDEKELDQLSQKVRGIDWGNTNAKAFEPEYITQQLKEDNVGGGHEHHHHHGSHEEHQGHNDHEHHHEEGEDQNHEHHGNNEHDHKDHQHAHSDEHQGHQGHQKEKHQHGEHTKHDHGEQEHGGHEGHNHGGHDHSGHGGHDHGGGMGFMSMVAMTKDMPRSMDGLAMEMNEARFGPFHPGLPDGLKVKIMLDGDTVMKAECEADLFNQHFSHHFPEDPYNLPDHLAKLDPTQKETYRTLALLALFKAAGKEDFAFNIPVLEKERIRHHLLWMEVILRAFGDQKMHYEVCRILNSLPSYSGEQIIAFLDKSLKRTYYKTRFKQTAGIQEKSLENISGPTARAAGKAEDLRETYYDNFKAISGDQNNAWGQWMIRVEEIKQSLELIAQHEEREIANHKDWEIKKEGKVSAQIEACTGKAQLELELADGKIQQMTLQTSSTKLVELIPKVANHQELSDALLGIAALGISPYEVIKKEQNSEHK